MLKRTLLISGTGLALALAASGMIRHAAAQETWVGTCVEFDEYGWCRECWKTEGCHTELCCYVIVNDQ